GGSPAPAGPPEGNPAGMHAPRNPRKPWRAALALATATTLTSGGLALATAGRPAPRGRSRLPRPLRRALPSDRLVGRRGHGRRPERHRPEVLHAGLPHPA